MVKDEIEKLSEERTTSEWIKIGANQLRIISKALLLALVLWGITFVILNYNLPATQKQIDKIVESNSIRDKRDSVEVISKAVKVEELNAKMSIADLKLQYVIKAQDEMKLLVLQVLTEQKSLNRSVKQGAYTAN